MAVGALVNRSISDAARQKGIVALKMATPWIPTQNTFCNVKSEVQRLRHHCALRKKRRKKGEDYEKKIWHPDLLCLHEHLWDW